MAFKVGEEITMSDLESFYRYKESNYRQKNRFSLDEAREKFPKWYEKRIINKEPHKSPQFKKHRAIYDKWKERILYKSGGAVDGTRFYCLEQLCALAVVCDISRDELLKDCNEILHEFERRTKHDDNHFTEADVKSALATYDNPNDGTYCRRLSTIYKKTNIKFT